MSTNAVIDLLQKLITLTSERDAPSLKLALMHALSSFVSPSSIAIYQFDGVHHREISEVNSLNHELTPDLSETFKHQLIACLKTAKPTKLAPNENGLCKYLYPFNSIKNQVSAVLVINQPTNDHQTALSINCLLQVYQNFIALINENERDTLTGLLNRKTFETKINKVFSALLSQHARKGDNINQKCFLAIFDIDHFKRVNDEFGHLIGDEVLLMFSQLMTKTFREQDMLFRFGGEEFVAIFECPSVQDMSHVINRFREKVANFNFPQIGKVTVSSGYTELAANDNASLLIDRADVALYYAKNNGRNCAYSYELLVADGLIQENKVDSDIELF